MSHTNLTLGTNWNSGEWPDWVDVGHEGAADSRRYVAERTRCAMCGAAFERPLDSFALCPYCGARAIREEHQWSTSCSSPSA